MPGFNARHPERMKMPTTGRVPGPSEIPLPTPPRENREVLCTVKIDGCNYHISRREGIKMLLMKQMDCLQRQCEQCIVAQDLVIMTDAMLRIAKAINGMEA